MFDNVDKRMIAVEHHFKTTIDEFKNNVMNVLAGTTAKNLQISHWTSVGRAE